MPWINTDDFHIEINYPRGNGKRTVADAVAKAVEEAIKKAAEADGTFAKAIEEKRLPEVKTEIKTDYFRISKIKRKPTNLDLETTKVIAEVINDMIRRTDEAHAALTKTEKEKRMENIKCITYLELLQMVKEDKQPKKIFTNRLGEDVEYTWQHGSYVDKNNKTLKSDSTFELLSSYGHVAERFICYRENILDDAEKRYLKGVIRPFRNSVKHIEKLSVGITSSEYIRIALSNHDLISFPQFPSKRMYAGMELNRRYTLEELGL